MAFNENTRVKIPAVLHLTQLGYEYISLKDAVWDLDANIFTDIFASSVKRINPDADFEPTVLLAEIKNLLDYEDLGRAFYNRLISSSEVKLIDFNNFDNNTFSVCTELPCKNGEEEFRPDITVLINGMPLVFIEVKKPNNHEGILAERKRINTRLKNNKFRRFLNAVQFMIFSNNMEYDNDSVIPIQGAFYASISSSEVSFNCFREEDEALFNHIAPLDEGIEKFILKDNNLAAIKESPEYITNKSPTKPTNRILSSLLDKRRAAFILRYALVYVQSASGVNKHIMRCPQIFATLAIERVIKSGLKRGIIWHTQGSGKTALAYFNAAYLTDYFQKERIVTKFYFIVDRLDLLAQAQTEFESRGLRVEVVNSREDFVKNIAFQGAIHNDRGEREITVVNIQKFSEDARVVKQSDYNLKIQRIYFLDEVHRSYNPSGSFLANLLSSDPKAIIIGLTGTPLILQKLRTEGGRPLVYNSKDIFGDYIHKYYYNSSIEDGYTLRLIREGIETHYRLKLKEIFEQIEVQKGSIKKSEIFSHARYVAALCNYIVEDFEISRVRLDDKTIGGMVVCESSEQARELHRVIALNHPQIKAALILYDEGAIESRKRDRDEFKRGNIDLLIVYNMLLTGFDAHRLKKLYLNRVLREHNLLQCLTRVNRPYKEMRCGFVVDFADIRSEFDKTNAAYLKELQDELAGEWDRYNNLFKSPEEIEAEIAEIKERLFSYNLENAEIFSEQINKIDDKSELSLLRASLENALILGNLIRLFGHNALADRLNFAKIRELFTELNNRIALISKKEALEASAADADIINIALENIFFTFIKVSEKELQIGVDGFTEQLRICRETFQSNFDHADVEYISLLDELKEVLKKKKIAELTVEDIENYTILIRSIYERLMKKNREDERIKEKYDKDEKFARIHKRIAKTNPKWRLNSIYKALLTVKYETDERILYQRALLNNEAFFVKSVQPIVFTSFKNFKNNGLKLDFKSFQQINDLVVNEYIKEYKGITR